MLIQLLNFKNEKFSNSIEGNIWVYEDVVFLNGDSGTDIAYHTFCPLNYTDFIFHPRASIVF